VSGQQNLWVDVAGIRALIERAAGAQGGASTGSGLAAERAGESRDLLFEMRPGKEAWTRISGSVLAGIEERHAVRDGTGSIGKNHRRRAAAAAACRGDPCAITLTTGSRTALRRWSTGTDVRPDPLRTPLALTQLARAVREGHLTSPRSTPWSRCSTRDLLRVIVTAGFPAGPTATATRMIDSTRRRSSRARPSTPRCAQ